jgi:hypothetical protein
MVFKNNCPEGLEKYSAIPLYFYKSLINIFDMRTGTKIPFKKTVSKFFQRYII